MKRLILFLILCSFTASAQITIAPYPVRDKDSTSASRQAYRFLVSKDSLKLWYHRTVSGDRFTGALRARSLGLAESNIYSGVEATGIDGSTVISYIRTLGDSSVRIGGSSEYLRLTKDSLYTTKRIISALPSYGNALVLPLFTIFHGAGGINTRLAQNLWFDADGNTRLRSNGYAQYILMQSAPGRIQFVTSKYAASGTAPTLNNVTVMDSVGRWNFGGNADATARVDIQAGDSATALAPFRIRSSGTGPGSLSGGGYIWNTGTYLLYQRNTDVWDTLSVLRFTGGSGTFAGWSRYSVAGIYTATVGDLVHLRVNAGDTTGTKLFTNYGTTDLRGVFNSSANWTVRDTTIFTSATFTFETPARWHGDTVASPYIGSRLSDKTIDGTSIFTGSGGVNTAGVLSVLNTGGTQATIGYNSVNKFTISVNSSGIATLASTGGITMALDGSNIANVSITAAQIANATITGGKIASATITGSNIASSTITGGLIASSTITGGNIAASTITGGNISTATITAGLIGNLEITAAQIANLTINGTKITSETLDSTKLKDGSISGPDIAANTIRASNIAALTITASEIAASTITGAKIAASTITAGNIVAGTITTTQIAASTITASNLNVSTLSAISANLGTVTAGNITGTDINIGSGAFHVTTAGALTATSATITGAITATSGTFKTAASSEYVELTGYYATFYSNGGTGGGQIYPTSSSLRIDGGNGLSLNTLYGGDIVLNPVGGSNAKVGSSIIWHAGNDGTGSGLDADLLDGNHAAAFWLQTAGYVTSAYGTKTAFSPNAQYLTTAADVHDVQVYKRAITINGVTVNVLVVD